MEETVHVTTVSNTETKVELTEEKHVGQYLKFIVLSVAVLHVILDGGLHLGWNALALIYKGERTYRHLCPTTKDTNTNEACDAEGLYLVNLYSVAAAVQFSAALPLGMLADKMGPKSIVIGQFLLLLTCWGLFLYTPSENALFDFNYILLSLLFGLRNLIGANYYHYANLFPAHFNLVSTFIGASTGISSATFLGFYMMWKFLNVSFNAVLLGFALIQTCLLIFALIQPTRRFNSGDRIMFSTKRWKLMPYTDKEIDFVQTTSHIHSAYPEETTLEKQFSSLHSSSVDTTASSVFSRTMVVGEVDFSPTSENTSSLLKKTNGGALPLTVAQEMQKQGVGNMIETLDSEVSATSLRKETTQVPKVKKRFWEPTEDGGIRTLLTHLLQLRSIILILCSLCFYVILVLTVSTINSQLLEKSGGNQVVADVYTFYFSFTIPFSFIGSLSMGVIGDKFGQVLMITLATFYLLISFLISLLPWLWVQFFYFIFFNFGADALFSGIFSICNKTAPKNWFATVMGIILTCGSLSTLISNIFAGMVLSKKLSPVLVNLVFACIIFLWMASSLCLFYHNRRSLNKKRISG